MSIAAREGGIQALSEIIEANKESEVELLSCVSTIAETEAGEQILWQVLNANTSASMASSSAVLGALHQKATGSIVEPVESASRVTGLVRVLKTAMGVIASTTTALACTRRISVA